tara:strand:- start:2828 stop:3640 length:813 start_codon:yes stop_codon:yes gene_type:complete
MANHDYNIANQTAPNFRADLNNALLAIVSTNSGSSAPSTTFANQLWYDTSANQLKMRNEADSAWIILLESDQTNARVNIITDDIQYATSAVTEVKNTSGTTILSLQAPTQSTAETGTETTQVMTPLRTKQSIQANAITSVVAGTGISVSTSSGAATVTNSISAGDGLTLSGSTLSLSSDASLTNVGSVILGVTSSSGGLAAGATVSGSNLYYAGLEFPYAFTSSGSVTNDGARIMASPTSVSSGTWRYHGRTNYNSASGHYGWGVWQRIT